MYMLSVAYIQHTMAMGVHQQGMEMGFMGSSMGRGTQMQLSSMDLGEQRAAAERAARRKSKAGTGGGKKSASQSANAAKSSAMFSPDGRLLPTQLKVRTTHLLQLARMCTFRRCEQSDLSVMAFNFNLYLATTCTPITG